MRQRCFNPNMPNWRDYGGRGITIGERWNDFYLFISDMGQRPDGYQIDRINNDGNYEPDNCKWSTRKQQNRNQRRTRIVLIEGGRRIAADLADIAGQRTVTIIDRFNRGLSLGKILSKEKLHNYDRKSLDAAREISADLQRAKTHCKHGHEFTAENTFMRAGKYRICRQCSIRRKREMRDRQSKLA